MEDSSVRSESRANSRSDDISGSHETRRISHAFLAVGRAPHGACPGRRELEGGDRQRSTRDDGMPHSLSVCPPDFPADVFAIRAHTHPHSHTDCYATRKQRGAPAVTAGEHVQRLGSAGVLVRERVGAVGVGILRETISAAAVFEVLFECFLRT